MSSPIFAESSSAAEVRVRNTVKAHLGRAIERIDWIPAGMGRRRFARIRFVDAGPPETVLARVDAPEDPAGRPAGIPPEPPLEPLRAWLERSGLPVPRRFGGEDDGGVELLEDLGSMSLEDAAQSATAAERRALYVEACDLVPRLQRVEEAPGVEAFRRRFETAHFAYKADFFIEWSLASRGRAATAAERAVVREAFARVADVTRAAPARLAHRDFQSANLYVTAGRGSDRLVMIDLQGALLAPPEYDLVCLLRDSYVELLAGELDFHLERVRAQLPDAPDPDTFATRFDLLTLTRKGKDHARFLCAAKILGEERFLACIPVTSRYLRRAAQRSAERDPRFRELAELISTLPESEAEWPCGG